ncbi:MAG: hypothetical protein II085_05495, partial [Alphaproteobacteria bacterium]|nr:hypothetical protein [Alphaproteobacteria bacterium]
YLGTVALENLKSLLSFEAIKIILGMGVAGKTGEEAADKTRNYENLDKLVSLQNISISEVTNSEGKAEYAVRYTDNNGQANTPESVLVFNTAEDAINFCMSRVMAELCIRYAYAKAQYEKQAQYREQRAQNNETQTETLQMIRPGEISANPGGNENVPVKPAPIPPDVQPPSAPDVSVVDVPQVPVQPALPEIPVADIPEQTLPDNPSSGQESIVEVNTPEEAAAKAHEALASSRYKIATAGYSKPPEGYEDITKAFLQAFDELLGRDETAYVTSPTTDKGSIDVITSEVAGLGDGEIFYTTAKEFIDFIDSESLPEEVDAQAYSEVPKFILPDAAAYSQATAAASNIFLATGGAVATVNDFVNAVNKGNVAIILDNTDLDKPAWDKAKSTVGNASKYIAEQINAVITGQPLPYPETGDFTRKFIEENLTRIDESVRVYQIDGKPESVNEAAKKAVEFIKSKTGEENPKAGEPEARTEETKPEQPDISAEDKSEEDITARDPIVAKRISELSEEYGKEIIRQYIDYKGIDLSSELCDQYTIMDMPKILWLCKE